ncbi:helix-turn-helix domain-containing protein [Sedimentisphaera salicampi]|uniref:Helix-turn-helix domain-containing protein n=1 Tax=Sedimentisphaera salicampi TaxID=1941349 RepID=A0A1W6LMW0_9BACT|nr:helix-turn-helix domain-containing protein [Sedimentisphaera salicampi]ARN57115.1 hypothetical protein STSP1_01510 [Sedimentisphaera salicampi]
MFFKLDADTAARKDLRASDKIILAIIQNYENQGEAYPGRRKLQEKSGLAAGTVCSSINRLESAGLLEVNRTGKGKSNTYKTGTKMRPVQKSDWSKNCTGSGLKNRPVQKSDWSKNCTGSGLKNRPVQKLDRSKNCTGSGTKIRPEPVQKLDHKRIRKEKSNVDEPSGYAFVLKGGKDYSLPKAKLEEYENTFAEVDIDSEFRKAQQWLRDNPAKRKTAAGMPRFLGSWLSRAQGSLKPKAQPAGEIFQRRDPTPEDLEIAFGKRGLD